MVDKIVTHKTDYPDSVEYGTPGKHGVLKVYFDASDEEGSKKRIASAVGIRAYFAEKLAEQGVIVGG
jgi:hypothetical protein